MIEPPGVLPVVISNIKNNVQVGQRESSRQIDDHKRHGLIRRCRSLVYIILATCLLTPSLIAGLNDDGDVQCWARMGLSHELSTYWKLYTSAEARFGDDVSRYYYQHVEILGAYILQSWCQLALGYRQIYKRIPSSSTHWRGEASPLFDLILKTPIFCHWTFQARSRWQYIVPESGSSFLLFRELVKLTSPWSWTRFHATPYLASESFFREGKGFDEERLSIGVSEPLIHDLLSGDVSYMFRLLRPESRWIHHHVVILELRWKV
jgi:hypothetical protein